MTTLQMPVTCELLSVLDRDHLPDGMKLLSVSGFNVVTRSCMATVEDANAPADLEGQTVYPIFKVEGLSVKIAGYDAA